MEKEITIFVVNIKNSLQRTERIKKDVKQMEKIKEFEENKNGRRYKVSLIENLQEVENKEKKFFKEMETTDQKQDQYPQKFLKTMEIQKKF